MFCAKGTFGQESKTNSALPCSKGAQTAVLYVYRPFKLVGSLVGYDLYINQTKVGRVKANKAFEVTVTPATNVELWAKTEAKRSLITTFDEGKCYYLHASVGWGFFWGRPKFELVNPFHGELEYKLVSKQIVRKEHRKEYRRMIKSHKKQVSVLQKTDSL